MQAEQYVRRSERAVFRELAESEGAVLLHLDTGAYHGLNPTGSLIWNLIGEGSTLGEVVEGVKSRMTGAPPGLIEDVEAFVADLVERDLLVLVEK